MVILMMVASFPGVAEELPVVDNALLVLANSDEPLAEDYAPEDLVKLISRRSGVSKKEGVYTVSSTSIQLRAEAAEALVKMCAASEDDKILLYVRQGYRSYKDEAARYARLEKRGEAGQKPGENDYQTGLAVTLVDAEWQSKTLTSEFADTKAAKWMAKNASKYGFVLRYPEGKKEATGWDAEPWHLRYVGVEAAAYMAANDLCLEEFCVMIQPQETAVPVEQDDQPETELLVTATAQPTAEPTAEPTPEPVYVPGQMVVLDEVGPDGDHEISFFQD